ncbi:COMM domain-containing protein 4, partial [Lamprotornis superbus]
SRLKGPQSHYRSAPPALGAGGGEGRSQQPARLWFHQWFRVVPDSARFRFCGDLDCPDWVLAEISTLAKISSVKLKLICAQVLRDLLGEAIEYDKILKLTSDAKLESGDVKATIAVLGFILSSAAKHNVDSESLSSELQQLGLPKGKGNPQGGTVSQTWWDVADSSHPAGVLCCPLSPPFCAISAWGLLRCFGGVWQLQVWCEQSGSSLVSPDEQSMPAGCAVPMRRSRALSRTGSGPAACDLGSVRWRVDYTLSSSELQEVNEPVVHLTFNVRDRESDKMTTVPVTLSANKFWVLLAELKQAQTLMNTLL